MEANRHLQMRQLPGHGKGFSLRQGVLDSRAEEKCAFSRSVRCCYVLVLNVFSPITRLFSTMSFAATDIFFKVIKAYIVIKEPGIKLGISCINYL